MAAGAHILRTIKADGMQIRGKPRPKHHALSESTDNLHNASISDAESGSEAERRVGWIKRRVTYDSQLMKGEWKLAAALYLLLLLAAISAVFE